MATLLRSGNATTKLVCGFHAAGITAPPAAGVAKVKPVNDTVSNFMTVDTLQKAATLATSQIHGAKGINVTSRRFAHTDVKFPNFDNYRQDSTLDASKPARETEDERRAVPVALYYGVGGMMSLFGVKEVVQTLVSYKAMAADQRALASIEIKMDDVPEGQTKTFEWRGKPVFVKHRTAAEIKREKGVNVSELRHPQHDDERVQKDEWSVVIGVCTHLGCVPIANAGDFGGYYCPCHGSHYDGSGRIRKGPAPLNLHVPAYAFKESTIVIGSS
ncbi:hypothetical protein L596_005343 [Steinernema carpocapsae]|uniref:Cytochrome b-c1 complex subunit Rieske, mitochondrial n=1 Tax=Steinernema carpocapsae TaxID=34508 RepID=A0A4U8UYT5_STECR|nr:hypothetical protein L596_005343 [Steinernema carpocapsae]